MRFKKFIVEKSNYPDALGTHMVIMHSKTEHGENYQRVFKGTRKECLEKKKEFEKYGVRTAQRPTHETRLLEYLKKHKTITSLDATIKLHNTRVGATVFNLRRKGYNIVTELTSGRNAYGDKVEYATYRFLD